MGERHSKQNRFAGTPRARRRPHKGGVAYVSGTDTISAGGCWCGERYGHDWPGKDEGAPHPRGSVTELEERMETRDQDRMLRSELKRYPRVVQELLLHLTNDVGIKYRHIDSQHVMLYPPDGVSRPFKVSASRPGPQQVHYLEMQFLAPHDIPGIDGVVPKRGNEEDAVETTEVTETPREGVTASEHLMALAKTLGVALEGSISEEDYLAVVAEKDYAEGQAQMLTTENENLVQQVDGCQTIITDLTAQRDSLLSRVRDLEDNITDYCARLIGVVKS